VCVVSLEHTSSRLNRVWLEGERIERPPFPCGPDTAAVAYYGSAEMTCFLALDWEMPGFLIDLYPEFRIRTNGEYLEHGSGLLGAMQYFGLNGVTAAKKDVMRERVLKGPPYSPQDRRQILNYCQSDVNALPQLFDKLMTDPAQYVPAFWRGAYMKALALAEFTGVPIDADLYNAMLVHWPALQSRVVTQVSQRIPVFDQGHFRTAWFEYWLKRRGLLAEWPRTNQGALALDEDTFKIMAALDPEIAALRQARQMLGQLHKTKLSVGPDGRNRCLLSAFATKTGRNAPSTAKFVFGAPSYMRALIQPKPGKALAYLDWKSQEFGIAAALSGDVRMQEAYNSGDPYLAFAKFAGALPGDATAETHANERELFKTVILGTQYAITAKGLCLRLSSTLREAQDLLAHHRRIFSRFWEWSDAIVDYGQLYGSLTAAFGWRLQTRTTDLRTMRNFLMQANGAEMLRLAMVFAMEAGVIVVAPVHDGLLLEAPESEIEEHTARMQEAMEKASRVILAGYPLRSEVKVTLRYPDRFLEKKGAEMWRWMTDSLRELGVSAAA
jgi:hypothetical protein